MIRDMMTNYASRARLLAACIMIKCAHLPLEDRLQFRDGCLNLLNETLGGLTSEERSNISSLEWGTLNMINRFTTELSSTEFSIRRVIFGK